MRITKNTNSPEQNLLESMDLDSFLEDCFEPRPAKKVKLDSVEYSNPREDKLDLIKERIRLGFYTSKDVEFDLADKLGQAFFDIG